jgi:hypothetical protein
MVLTLVTPSWHSNSYKCNSKKQHNQLINRCKLILPPQVPFMQFAQSQYQHPQSMLQQLQPVMQANTMMNHPQMMVPYQKIPKQGNFVDQVLQQLLQILQGNAASQGQPQQGLHQQGNYQVDHHGGPI